MEDLERYLKDVVQPTVQEYRAEPGSSRRAQLACLVLFHSVDYLAYPNPASKLRTEWRKRSEDFKIIDDIAHAFKHYQSTTSRRRTKTTDISMRSNGAIGTIAFNTYPFDSSSSTVVVATYKNLDLLKSVLQTERFLVEQVQGARTLVNQLYGSAA
jgi:hypothetical protein